MRMVRVVRRVDATPHAQPTGHTAAHARGMETEALMSRQKQKGTAFETAVTRWLQWALGDPTIHRETLHGSKDRGDIGGVIIDGEPVTIEAKSHRRMELAEWMREAETEAGNMDGVLPVVVHKRSGVGIQSREGVGSQWVTMTLETFARILNHCIELGPELGPEDGESDDGV